MAELKWRPTQDHLARLRMVSDKAIAWCQEQRRRGIKSPFPEPSAAEQLASKITAERARRSWLRYLDADRGSAERNG